MRLKPTLLPNLTFRLSGHSASTTPTLLLLRHLPTPTTTTPKPTTSRHTHPPHHLPTSHRPFSSTPPLPKQKKGAQKQSASSKNPASSNAAARSEAAGDDPADFSGLDAEIGKALARLKDELSKVRPGGRIGPDMVEALRVELKGGGGKVERVRVADVAQVVPRGGRSLLVFVGDESHTKPITSALQGSQYGLNPVPNPHKPLELEVAIPAPTRESREAAKKDVGKLGDRVLGEVKDARAKHQKTLRAMEVSNRVRPEDVKRARDAMEKRIQEANGEVKKVVDGAKKALDA